jgi:excisionase family DNA binding protein
MAHPNKKWLTPREAAEYCGISLDELRNLARLGEVPYKRRGDRGHRRYHVKHLDTWLAEGNVRSTQSRPDKQKRSWQRRPETGDSQVDWFVDPTEWGTPLK